MQVLQNLVWGFPDLSDNVFLWKSENSDMLMSCCEMGLGLADIIVFYFVV